MNRIPLWRRFEWALSATGAYRNALTDVKLEVVFTSPDGETFTREGFWDGGSQWKIRFSPGSVGKWTASTRCEPADPGLHAQTSDFLCLAEDSANPLHQHGPVSVKPGETMLRHADGKPFFWLGDTAWNIVLKSQMSELQDYLDDRASKCFNVVQFVATHWMASAGNAEGRVAYFGQSPIEVDPQFFRWMDRRLDAINDHGFLGAAVIAWAAVWNQNVLRMSPGTDLPNDDIVRLGRYFLARYGAHHMAWILAGDGHYLGSDAERWRQIGRAVFKSGGYLATIHPGGHLWLEEEFRQESWFRFHGYQSGHWRGPDAMRWMRRGPAFENRSRTPAVPQINLEFCYEAHEDFETHLVFNAFDVRQHAYASLLATAPAGITYGAHGIWSWEAEPSLPMSHPKTGLAPAWWEAIHLAGSTSMKRLFEIFSSIEWWRLRPAPQLLPDNEEGSAAASDDGDFAIVYVPSTAVPAIRRDLLLPGFLERTIDPATGGAPHANTVDLVILFTRLQRGQ